MVYLSILKSGKVRTKGIFSGFEDMLHEGLSKQQKGKHQSQEAIQMYIELYDSLWLYIVIVRSRIPDVMSYRAEKFTTASIFAFIRSNTN